MHETLCITAFTRQVDVDLVKSHIIAQLV